MKLTAPQLRVLRLMADGWTLYAGPGTGWMARLRKDGEQFTSSPHWAASRRGEGA